MGAIQNSINSMLGTAAVGAAGIKHIAEESKPESKQDTGIDAKMAAKARKEMQQKINTIYANKDLSQKARTRRVGIAMDEYQKRLGGKE